MRSPSQTGDRGSITPLILGFAMLLLLLMTVIVATSRVFLAQRALSAAADGAATAAADTVDIPAYYNRPHDLEALPLDEAGIEEVVEQYVEGARLRDRFTALESPTWVLSPDATTVTVQLTAEVPVPIIGALLPEAAANGIRISAAASARSAVP